MANLKRQEWPWEKHTLQRVGLLRKPRGLKIWGGQFLWVGQLHRLMTGRIIPTILEKGQRFRNWTTAHFLTFYVQPQNCHGAGVCVIQIPMCYNEHIMKLKVHWKSNLLLSWIQLFLASLCHVFWLCYSFKDHAQPPSLLFQFQGEIKVKDIY